MNSSDSCGSKPQNSDSPRRDKQKLKATIRESIRRRAKNNLLAFVLATCALYRAGWFHRELAGVLDWFLDEVAGGRRPRVIVQAPPQHGKSELISRRFPAYALGRNPDLAIIATSHTAELAQRFSREVQRIMDSDRYHLIFPETRIVGRYARQAEATRQLGLFEIAQHLGMYRGCGIGGPITGMRADILLIDDPVKDDAEANSQLQRDATWDWFTSTAYTRLSEGGGIIVVATRWHQDDLIGRLLSAQAGGLGDTWRVLSYPAIAERDEPHRRLGEPLSVERFSLEALLDIKRVIGPYKWAALYEQHPAPPEGRIIQRAWPRYYTVVPASFDEIIQSWDLSFKDSPGTDFVAGHVWGRKGGQFFLLDRVHGRFDFPATLLAILSLSAKWPEAVTKLVEDAANGPAVVATLRERIPGLIAVPAEGSKLSRIHAVCPLFEAGNVFVPDPSIAPWVNDVVTEWTSFPNGRNDDDCDAMGQALRRLQRDAQYGGPPPFIVSYQPIPGLTDTYLPWADHGRSPLMYSANSAPEGSDLADLTEFVNELFGDDRR